MRHQKVDDQGLAHTERREFSRESKAGMRIRFQPMGQPINQTGELYGALIDSNHRGLCMEVGIPLQQEQVLRLSFPINDQKTTVPSLAEVRWVLKKGLDKEEYRIGVQFLL